MIKLTINGEVREYPQGTILEDIAKEYQKPDEPAIVLAFEDKKIRELHRTVAKDSVIEFITLRDTIGHKAYGRSVTMLFMKALSDVLGGPVTGKAKVEFTIGNGTYISSKGDYKVSGELVEQVSARMRELAEANIPINKRAVALDDAIADFESRGMTDKAKLFKYRLGSSVNVYSIDNYKDYYYGYMLPSTGYLKHFGLIQYKEGFMLILPDEKDPQVVKEFEPREKLFNALYDSTVWNNHFNIDDVGDLNDQICAGNTEHMILVQEALQERRIGEIASEIVSRGGIKFIMIAGPSSSGKTSFSHRLSIQLRTHGLTPHPIALDNYFVNRENTPRDEKGDFDYECLEALDVKQFNDDMLNLLAGKEVSMPTYNFKTGHREYNGNIMKLEPDDILVIEGIHGLNPKMSYALPDDSKFKVYISALTSLNVDGHNRIPTTDGRLLRRMVRDYRTRGASAKRTIQMWPNVRKGEESYIFPFQEGADVMFNSVLIYELAALKQYAEPILYSISPEEPEYYEAKRLLKFLGYFLSIPSESLPNNSIAREFVGGSCFDV